MARPVQTLLCSVNDVRAVFSRAGLDLRLDDDGSGAVSATEGANLTAKGMNWAADLLYMFLSERYRPSDLTGSWQVNGWAAWLTALFVAQRRLPAVPASLYARVYGKGEAPGIMGMLREVYDFRRDLPGVTERSLV